MDFFAWLFIAYFAGTVTGFALYRRTLIGRISIAFEQMMRESQQKRLDELTGRDNRN